MARQSSSWGKWTTRLLLLAFVALLVTAGVDAKKAKKGPKITHKVFFDVSIGGEPAGTHLHGCMTPLLCRHSDTVFHCRSHHHGTLCWNPEDIRELPCAVVSVS